MPAAGLHLRLPQEGQITDEARRRIERELDLEEASLAFNRKGEPIRRCRFHGQVGLARNAIGDIEVPKLRSNNPALALEVELFPGQACSGFLMPMTPESVPRFATIRR
jgi:hypothetical protein